MNEQTPKQSSWVSGLVKNIPVIGGWLSGSSANQPDDNPLLHRDETGASAGGTPSAPNNPPSAAPEKAALSPLKKQLFRPDEDGHYAGLSDATDSDPTGGRLSSIIRQLAESGERITKADWLHPDADGSYRALIDLCELQPGAMGNVLNGLAQHGEYFTKADWMHKENGGEPAIVYDSVLSCFEIIVMDLASRDEHFTLSELGRNEYGDGSPDHEKGTVLQSAGEENKLAAVFQALSKVEWPEFLAELHTMIPDAYKDQVDLLAINPLPAIDITLTKQALLTPDANGISPFDKPHIYQHLPEVSQQLELNGHGKLTLSDLNDPGIPAQKAPSILYKLVEQGVLADVLKLAAASGEPKLHEHLCTTFTEADGTPRSVVVKAAEMQQLDIVFPIPGDAPESRIWTEHPQTMANTWRRLPDSLKAELPDFDARLTLTNAASLHRAADFTLEY